MSNKEQIEEEVVIIDVEDKEKMEIVEVMIIDIEEHVKTGKEIPHGHKYRIRIDKTYYVVHKPSITGRELLELASKVPIDQYRIYQKLKGGESIEVAYDEEVDLIRRGIERFMTLKLDNTEGAL